VTKISVSIKQILFDRCCILYNLSHQIHFDPLFTKVNLWISRFV